MRQFFSSYDNSIAEDARAFLGGTVSWNTLFRETFGEDSEELLNYPDSACSQEFSHLLSAGLHFYREYTASVISCDNNLNTYMVSVVERLRELRSFEHIMESSPSRSYSNILFGEYRRRLFAIQHICSCSECILLSHDHHAIRNNRTYCLVGMAETILGLVYLIGICDLKSDLKPKRSGVLSLYQNMLSSNRGENIEMLVRHLTFGSFRANTSFLFNTYMTLFTATPVPLLLGADLPSACSNGAVYCILNGLTELSMDFGKSSKVCIGAGIIECRSRVHTWVFDKKKFTGSEINQAYDAEKLTCTKDLSVLTTDTSSPSLRVEAVVENVKDLVFYYQILSDKGKLSVPPAWFVYCCLLPIALLKVRTVTAPVVDQLGNTWKMDLDGSMHGLVFGEGRAPLVSNTALILRPHRGNLLGQCVCLTWYPRQSAFITSDAELDTFLKWYARQAKESVAPFFVISG